MNRSEIKKYCWYAIGEVLLIFVGITLALWFENWNEARHEREMEIIALEEIADNLRANVSRFETSMAYDLSSVESCRALIANLEQKSGWSDETAKQAYDCRWWTSPYLRSAAYESLKTQGMQLISNRSLRSQIVALYELFYNYLINDTDRSSWDFQDAVIEPQYNRELRRTAAEAFTPVNYQQLTESAEFINMISMKMHNQLVSIRDQQISLDETTAVIDAVEQELARLNSP